KMSNCVHCNHCGVFPSPNCTSFCVSNCGHIFCKECIDKGRLSTMCNRCRALSPKFITIDRNLSPDLQVMFKRPGQIVDEHTMELQPAFSFQNAQLAMRLKGQNALLKKEREKSGTLQSQVTIMKDEVKDMQKHCNEQRSRSRHSSLDKSHHSSRGDVSEMSSHSHHHTMSSMSSMDTSYSDPFKTPVNGLKRFTTSTPKVSQPIGGSSAKKMNDSSFTTGRLSHSSTIPSLSSFSMEIDEEDIVDVTPAQHKSRVIPPQTPQPHKTKSGRLIDFDPILSNGGGKKILPKTPAPTKNMQSLSMAERLSAPRPGTSVKTPKKPEMTSSTPGPASISKPKTPQATPG
ncbi:hypothetical protein PFISCL1PPCAC_20513, partial [Pristionchus fissidentatus]